jgi:lipoprotein NlpI
MRLSRREILRATSIVVLGLLSLSARSAIGTEPEQRWPEWRTGLVAKLGEDLTKADAAVVQSPNSVSALSHRGDVLLFLGRFPEAVADFEKMIALDPAEDAPHWRLGIAYYFAGQFEKSARQFEKYHAYDGHDRENGIWKFLAQARAEGIDKARAGMLQYTQFDREPFPELYEMFAGKRTADDVLTEVQRKGLSEDHIAVFFANYYGGLNEALLGHREQAIAMLRKTVEDPEARKAGYMWQVARLHWEQLVSDPARK